MKAERRHELQTNELADFLAHGVEKYRHHLSSVVWAGVALVAVVVAVSMWSSRSGSSQAQAWEEFDQIRNVDAKVRPKRLKELAERYPNSDVALWARLDLADQLCFDGREKMPLDREIARTLLKEAQQTYAAVLHDPKARPEMIRRAALAEPKCWELMGERDKAIESYKDTAQRFRSVLPEVAADAAKHASDLDQPEAADFYKWLAEYKPPMAPSLNTPGFAPSFPPLGEDRETGSGALAPGTRVPAPSDLKTKEPSSETSTPLDSPDSPPVTTESPKKDQQTERPADPN